MLVGIYSRLRDIVKFFHWKSSSCGGVLVLLFCLPLSAMSWLKSPHSVYMWLGCRVIWLVISSFSCGMRRVSSMCVGIYMCIISQGSSGWFFIFIICMYGEIFVGIEILATFLGNAYLLWISVSRPPLSGVYNILCCMHLVRACVSQPKVPTLEFVLVQVVVQH